MNVNPHYYEFPANSIITYAEKTIDLSKIGVDLSGIFIGGIGYGGNSCGMLASGVRSLGSSHIVKNLPFCIEAATNPFTKALDVCIVSAEGADVDKSTLTKLIEDSITSSTHINIPLDRDGHASIITFILSEQKATLRFYDSLAPEVISYEKRYNSDLKKYLITLLPTTVSVEDNNEVFHLLDQGERESKGCGYFSIFTALLIKNNEEFRRCGSSSSNLFYTQSDDKRIRAELVIRSMLYHGLENIDTKYMTLMTNHRKHIYNRIQDAVIPLIKALKERL